MILKALKTGDTFQGKEITQEKLSSTRFTKVDENRALKRVFLL